VGRGTVASTSSPALFHRPALCAGEKRADLSGNHLTVMGGLDGRRNRTTPSVAPHPGLCEVPKPQPHTQTAMISAFTISRRRGDKDFGQRLGTPTPRYPRIVSGEDCGKRRSSPSSAAARRGHPMEDDRPPSIGGCRQSISCPCGFGPALLTFVRVERWFGESGPLTFAWVPLRHDCSYPSSGGESLFSAVPFSWSNIRKACLWTHRNSTPEFRLPGRSLFINGPIMFPHVRRRKLSLWAWQVYELTHRPIDLLYRLVLFLPGAVFLPASRACADRYTEAK